MIAKVFTILCLFGLSRAGHLSGGYSDYAVAPSYGYSAPIAYSAPAHAVSHVSQYNVHSAPVVKAYAPVVKTYAPIVKAYAPIVKAYAPIAPVSYEYSSPYVGHSYSAPVSYGYSSYGGYGHGGYGGYANKYAW